MSRKWPPDYLERQAARVRLRTQCAEAQNWRCCYCGCRLDPETVTLEHVIPQSQGGPTHWTNCVAACYRCNQFRDSRPIAEEIDARKLLIWWRAQRRGIS